MSIRDQFGWEIKKGLVFGFLCAGRGPDGRRIYRFGKTTKQFGLGASRSDKMSKLNFSGMNKAAHVVLWEPVDHVIKAWDLMCDYLRNHETVSTKTKRPTFKHEAEFGANYYSADVSTKDVEEHMNEAFTVLFKKGVNR